MKETLCIACVCLGRGMCRERKRTLHIEAYMFISLGPMHQQGCLPAGAECHGADTLHPFGDCDDLASDVLIHSRKERVLAKTGVESHQDGQLALDRLALLELD